MTSYIGIDLGTTNSAICSYDGQEVLFYKSPDQTDVTPSAIWIDKRGNRYVGLRAYINAASWPENAALQFKRLIGTATPIKLPGVGLSMTPEECSSEILRTLFSYLPDAIRNDPDVGTVITVPAAFNQMQKDATTEAARSAGLGRVALMQEPVAAVMSVMRSRKGDGTFLVYDLGGGTLDIAIAQSSGGRVSLLGQGGISMCGGRDFDKRIVEIVVIPWLQSKFDLPEGFATCSEYKRLVRMAEFAAEKAKIELSGRDDAMISALEDVIRIRDRSSADIYIDVPVTRTQLDGLIDDKVSELVAAARDTIERTGLTPQDIERIVFVGGPTQYKPLRDRVAFGLGIAPSTDVNPMTAVAAGAAVFAEAIDWNTESRTRKLARGSVSAGTPLKLTINYTARTPSQRTKIALKLEEPPLPGSGFQIDSVDTGWSSGRAELRNGVIIEVPLQKQGDNTFKIFVFDPSGGPLTLGKDRIVIARTAATVDAIPASHSIAIEARDKVAGSLILAYLVRAGDQLPAKGRLPFKAEESLRSGAAGSLKFKIWEGDIEHPITNNAFIGLFEIRSDDFEGVIVAGSDLFVNYEITDFGVINLTVDVPSVGGSFGNNRNFYSRRTAMVDYSNAASRIKEDAETTARQISELADKLSESDLAAARQKVECAAALEPTEADPEAAKQAADNIQEAKRLLAEARKSNLQVIRRAELDRIVSVFDTAARQHAKATEAASFDRLRTTAEGLIARPGQEFEVRLREMGSKTFTIMARQDWFIVDRFNLYVAEWAHLFADQAIYEQLIAEGRKAIAANDVDRLRKCVMKLDIARIRPADADDLVAAANIVVA